MKQKIYIPVKAEDELPPVPGYYIVINVGEESHNNLYRKEYEGRLIDGHHWRNNHYWLKPVEMPSEEEMLEYLIEMDIENYTDEEKAKAIIALMKGEKL